jgi:hypothetical protein
LDLNDNLLLSVPEEISQLTELKLFTFERSEINYTDQSNKKFMQAVAEMQKSGVVCKPDIDMNYLDQSGPLLETND